jgi:hypothetical protein
MDLTLEQILEQASMSDDEEILELYKLVESVAARLRKKQQSKIIANDANLTFVDGKYSLNIGNIHLVGREVQYTDIETDKAKICIWGDKCNKNSKCKFFHPGSDGRIMHYGDSKNMKLLLGCPVDQLSHLVRVRPEIYREIINLKDKVLDGLIRLLWLSSDDIAI